MMFDSVWSLKINFMRKLNFRNFLLQWNNRFCLWWSILNTELSLSSGAVTPAHVHWSAAKHEDGEAERKEMEMFVRFVWHGGQGDTILELWFWFGHAKMSRSKGFAKCTACLLLSCTSLCSYCCLCSPDPLSSCSSPLLLLLLGFSFLRHLETRRVWWAL